MQQKEVLPIGTILNSGIRKYTIKSVLGQGGFGITYLATSRVLVDNIPFEVQFAIKEHYISAMNERNGLSVDISNDNNTGEIKESIDSFLVEAQRLNKMSLNHPGIVRVNESFRANGTAYYVMEYIKGESLREHVKRSPLGRIPEAEAVGMFRPLAETIGYLHDYRVTHLDIKPDNVLIRENGQPVLIDFGLSKHYSAKGTPTSTIKAAGCSAGYSPMEQYVGITTFTPEADIYALAATLLYMLTGKDPMVSTEINDDIIRRSLPREVSERTTEAIVKAMEKLKEQRYHRIKEFLSELLVSNDKERKLDKNKYKDKNRIINSDGNHTTPKTLKKGNKVPNAKKKKQVLKAICITVILIIGWFSCWKNSTDTESAYADTTEINTDISTVEETPITTNSEVQSQRKQSSKESVRPDQPQRENDVKQDLKSEDWDKLKKMARQGSTKAADALARHYLYDEKDNSDNCNAAMEWANLGSQGVRDEVHQVLITRGFLVEE